MKNFSSDLASEKESHQLNEELFQVNWSEKKNLISRMKNFSNDPSLEKVHRSLIRSAIPRKTPAKH